MGFIVFVSDGKEKEKNVPRHVQDIMQRVALAFMHFFHSFSMNMLALCSWKSEPYRGAKSVITISHKKLRTLFFPFLHVGAAFMHHNLFRFISLCAMLRFIFWIAFFFALAALWSLEDFASVSRSYNSCQGQSCNDEVYIQFKSEIFFVTRSLRSTKKFKGSSAVGLIVNSSSRLVQTRIVKLSCEDF